MDDLFWIIFLGLLFGLLYFTLSTEVADSMSDFDDYSGHVIVNKVDRVFIIPSMVILRSDTSRTRFFVDDVIYNQLKLGEEININSIDGDE